MKNISQTWLIVVILISAILISFVIYHKPEGRYQFQVSVPGGVMWVLDTRTGTLVDLRSSDLVKHWPNPVTIHIPKKKEVSKLTEKTE